MSKVSYQTLEKKLSYQTVHGLYIDLELQIIQDFSIYSKKRALQSELIVLI